MAKKVSLYGMLVALAFIFSYIESLIPIPIGIPGVKLGLANLVVVVSLYTVGSKGAFAVSMIRILLAGFAFSGINVMLYSFAGGILSYCVMAVSKEKNWFSILGISVLGGVCHNIGQVLVAVFQLENSNMWYYLAVLLVSGCITGLVIGMVSKIILRTVNHKNMA